MILMKSLAKPSTLLKLSVFCAGLAGFAYAQAQTVAFIDVQRLRNETVAFKTAEVKVGQEFAKRVGAFHDKEELFRSGKVRLDRDGPTMAPADKNKLEHDLVDLSKELQRMQREIQEDSTQRSNEEQEVINSRVRKVIAQIALENKIDLVIPDALYHSAKIDITDKVLTAVNKQQ
jgi:outer membrane protein